jgi:peptide chain release factor 3
MVALPSRFPWRALYLAARAQIGYESAAIGATEQVLTAAPAPRRTFAIISHPDAGKTTLTEHLLLGGGAIHLAGQVKARGERRRARSDWMKIEQARGISVTTSVMTFDFGGATFNLLDTPGHEDFSEDTYRTLTAVDSAVMVIDAAKGIEAQTLKLFEVCRLRDVPIVTFINKLDRESRDPFELLDEVASKLALDTTPLLWPVGMGQNFRGCWDIAARRFLPFGEQSMTAEERAKLDDDLELIGAGHPPFSTQAYLEGHLTPVVFGAAIKGFAVPSLLETLAAYAPAPKPQPAEPRAIDPGEPKVTGFVFKVQANMDPNHRDRVAFLRLCSGRFQRGMKLIQVRTGKPLAVRNPIFFFAQDRELADQAMPGDIIGVPNHGLLRVGDALTEGEQIRFTGIPNFAPELLMRVRLGDPMRAKHLRKALEDLAEEGVTQVFRPLIGAQWIVGVVGRLQIDVLSTRIESEYGLEVGFEAAPYETARWIAGEKQAVERFIDGNRGTLALDRDDNPVYLAKSAWELGYTTEKWKDIRFDKVRERA